MNRTHPPPCLLKTLPNVQRFQPQAEDILTDEDLLELFRIIKQIIRKKPDAERMAKLYFCIAYAMGDLHQFYRPIHSDCIIFRDESNINADHITAEVVLPTTMSCCQNDNIDTDRSSSHHYRNFSKDSSDTQDCNNDSNHENQHHNHWKETNTHSLALSPQSLSSTSSASQQTPVPQRLLSVSYLTNPAPEPSNNSSPQLPQIMPRSEETSTDQYSVRPYTNIRPIYPSPAYPIQPSWPPIDKQSHNSTHHSPHTESSLQETRQQSQISSNQPAHNTSRYPHLNTLINGREVLMEPKQRGFYYQDGRISKEPALLQRYAEQGVLTQASLMRKRKKPFEEHDFANELNSALSTPAKKPKIPHRHGEFKHRRDDIISRMRTVLMTDLEQKAQRLPSYFALCIEKVTLPENLNVEKLSKEEASQLLAPALRILTQHSNMKPHLDNGMNQNGIYYNNDYFTLYLAFVQFQNIFTKLFPNEVIRIAVATSPASCNVSAASTSQDDVAPSPTSSISERDKDRERNANMKAYRVWIEPFLSETNWAAFRRNIMVGERIMQLAKVVGQGILLMTKELSGSKLHLTFTNNEWEEFMQGLSQGLWDETIDWTHDEDNMNKEWTRNGSSLLVSELRLKFATHFWFTEQGNLVPTAERKAARLKERQSNGNK